MKKLYFTISALVAVLFAGAQSLAPTVIASSGAYSVNQSANVSLSYTVGEMTMVETFNHNGTILTQGFQQPSDTTTITGLVDLTQDEFGSFVVYPNPAVDNMFFAFRLPEQGKAIVSMYNTLGQKTGDIYHSNYDNGTIIQTTNVSTLAAGVYFLTLTFTSDKTNQTHVITKKFQVVN